MQRVTLYSVDLDESMVMSQEELDAPMGLDSLQATLTRNSTYDGFFREFTASLM